MAIPTLEEIMKYKGKTYAGTMNKAFTRPEVTSGTNLTNPNLNSGLAGGIAGGVMSIAPMTPKSPRCSKTYSSPETWPIRAQNRSSSNCKHAAQTGS